MKRETTEYRVIQVKDINIGENIRDMRMEHGLKQTDVVRELQLKGVDVSIYSYNRIEKGTQNSTVSLLLGICDILGCNMNEIFGLDEDDKGKKSK